MTTLEAWQLASAAALFCIAVGMIGALVWSLRDEDAGPDEDCSDFDAGPR